MDDTITITFDTDPYDLGGVVYFDLAAFSDFTSHMSDTESEELNKHVDDLLTSSKRGELAQYSFVTFTKPADLSWENCSAEPIGREHAEWRCDNVAALTQKRRIRTMKESVDPFDVHTDVLPDGSPRCDSRYHDVDNYGDVEWARCTRAATVTVRVTDRRNGLYDAKACRRCAQPDDLSGLEGLDDLENSDPVVEILGELKK